MKLTQLALVLAIGGFSSNAALAQSDDWSGFYIGANIGNVDGSSDVSTSTVFSPTGYFATTSVPAIETAGSGSLSPSGSSGGLSAGYNVHYDNILFGIESDYNFMDAEGNRTAGNTYPCCAPTSFTITQQTKVSNLFTFRGRLGVTHENSLFYVTAGWAQAELEINDSFSDTFASASESFSDSQTKSGLIYGAGYEHAFANKWSMKFEYLHADFGKVSGTSTNFAAFSPAISFPTSVFTHTTDAQLNMFRIGVNYRF